MSITFTDAAVASGHANFDLASAYGACGMTVGTGYVTPCVSEVLAASGYVGSDLSPYGSTPTDEADTAHGDDTGFHLTFNPDGTLSGSMLVGSGVGDVDTALSEENGVWSGFGGSEYGTDGWGPVQVAGYFLDPSDPVGLPAPSSAALLVTALGLGAIAAGRIKVA